jgi:hypothetical protein
VEVVAGVEVGTAGVGLPAAASLVASAELSFGAEGNACTLALSSC